MSGTASRDLWARLESVMGWRQLMQVPRSPWSRFYEFLLACHETQPLLQITFHTLIINLEDKGNKYIFSNYLTTPYCSLCF